MGNFRIWPKPRRMTAGVCILFTGMLLAILFASTLGSADPGGAPSANLEYNCSGSCHTTVSESAISMKASKTDPAAGEQITVTVTVSGAEAQGTPIGAFLLVKFTRGESQPSDQGWTIVSDPSGETSYNYYLMENTFGGGAEFTWTLKAPAMPGNYSLYAREHHGGGWELYREFSDGLDFKVGPPKTVKEDDGSSTSTATFLLLGGAVVVIIAGVFVFMAYQKNLEKKAKENKIELAKEEKRQTLDPGMVRCPECSCELKKKNLKKHLEKVHS
jgi:hypothetical protein